MKKKKSEAWGSMEAAAASIDTMHREASYPPQAPLVREERQARQAFDLEALV